ncbi:MAG: hypothetical protein KF680_02130 [Cryobacterium sp.]|nr:hypothetical protein [Cryobacterium sp.]
MSEVVSAGSTDARSMSSRRVRVAGTLQLIQGGLMEGLPFLGLLVALALGIDQAAVTERAQIFALAYLNDNLYLMMIMSGIFGALRVVASIGLFTNRMWGLVLSLVMCTVTLVLMTFMLPAGIVDGLLSGTALVLLLTVWSGSTPIIEPRLDLHEDDESQGPV